VTNVNTSSRLLFNHFPFPLVGERNKMNINFRMGRTSRSQKMGNGQGKSLRKKVSFRPWRHFSISTKETSKRNEKRWMKH